VVSKQPIRHCFKSRVTVISLVMSGSISTTAATTTITTTVLAVAVAAEVVVVLLVHPALALSPVFVPKNVNKQYCQRNKLISRELGRPLLSKGAKVCRLVGAYFSAWLCQSVVTLYTKDLLKLILCCAFPSVADAFILLCVIFHQHIGLRIVSSAISYIVPDHITLVIARYFHPKEDAGVT
jgi:hypothetical protein